MGLWSELRKKLGIDDEEAQAADDQGIMVPPPAYKAHGIDPSTFGKTMELKQTTVSPAEAAGLEPLPPEKYTAYVGDDKGIEWSPTREGAKTMAEASLAKRLKDAERYGSVRPEELQAETNTPGGEEALALARRRNREPTPAEVLADYESKGNTDKANKPTPPIAKKVTGASDEEKARLAAAFESAGVNPEESGDNAAVAAETKSTEPDAPAVKRRPLGFVGPLDVEHPNRDPEQQAQAGASGGPIGEVAKLVMGSNDPRFADLKKSLSRREQLLKQADAEAAAGSGADIAGGTHFNTNAGEGTRALANAVGQDAETRLKQRREEGDYESRQLSEDQTRQLRTSAEGRAQAGELRAQAEEGRKGNAEQRAQAEEGRRVAEEGRKGKKFDIEAGRSDPNSEVSRHARAEMETLYGAQWKKIPQEVRDSFTADDVDRFFKEASTKELNGRVGSGGMQDRFEEKQVQDYNKSRVTDRTVDAVNNLMGRLEDKSPIEGFDAAKGWSQASKIPLLGGLLSGAGNSAVRGTEMEGIAQDAMAIMQQISLDTSGKVLNETEIRNIEKRLGLAVGQGEEAFRRAMSREFDAIQSKADRDFNSYSPGARERIERRELRPKFKAKKPDYAPREKTVIGERFGNPMVPPGGPDLSYGD